MKKKAKVMCTSYPGMAALSMSIEVRMCHRIDTNMPKLGNPLFKHLPFADGNERP